jgi:hypothetical protein
MARSRRLSGAGKEGSEAMGTCCAQLLSACYYYCCSLHVLCPLCEKHSIA